MAQSAGCRDPNAASREADAPVDRLGRMRRTLLFSLRRVNCPRHRSRANYSRTGAASQMRNPPEDLIAASNEVATHVVNSRSAPADAR